MSFPLPAQTCTSQQNIALLFQNNNNLKKNQNKQKNNQTKNSLEFLANAPGKIPFCSPREEYDCVPRYHPVCFSAPLNTPDGLGCFRPGYFLDLQHLRLLWALLLRGQPCSPHPPWPQLRRFQHGYYLRCDKFLDVTRDGPSSSHMQLGF